MGERRSVDPVIAALDVGGSSIKAGVVEGAGVVGEVTVTDVDHAAPLDDLVALFAAAIRSIPPTDRIAIAVPGPFDHGAGRSRMRHKFAALFGVDLARAVGERLDRPVVVRFCNDAAAAVVGEAVAGAGTPYQRVLGVTLGTGLGAALAVDGRLVERVAGITIGEAHSMPMPGGASADDVVSARAYLERVDRAADPCAEAGAFGQDLAGFVGPIAEAVAADVLLIGGGGAASFAAFGPELRAHLPIPVGTMSLGRSAALIGAVAICFGADDRADDPTRKEIPE